MLHQYTDSTRPRLEKIPGALQALICNMSFVWSMECGGRLYTIELISFVHSDSTEFRFYVFISFFCASVPSRNRDMSITVPLSYSVRRFLNNAGT
jgi:hypothetical protein